MPVGLHDSPVLEVVEGAGRGVVEVVLVVLTGLSVVVESVTVVVACVVVSTETEGLVLQ